MSATIELPGFAGMQTRRFQAGFCFMGSGVAASRKWSRARSGFRAQRKSAPGLRGEQPGRLSKGVGRKGSWVHHLPNRWSDQGPQQKKAAPEAPLPTCRTVTLDGAPATPHYSKTSERSAKQGQTGWLRDQRPLE